jgi:hypothetical protein
MSTFPFIAGRSTTDNPTGSGRSGEHVANTPLFDLFIWGVALSNRPVCTVEPAQDDEVCLFLNVLKAMEILLVNNNL